VNKIKNRKKLSFKKLETIRKKAKLFWKDEDIIPNTKKTQMLS